MNNLIYPHKLTRVINMLDKQLELNSHKGNTWQKCDHLWLKNKLHEEYAECILSPNNPNEYADLANICNMLIWRYTP